MKIQDIETKNGWLRGEDKDDYLVFRGVPFARPPVGELRFAPPQKAPAWYGLREALSFPPRSVQSPQTDGFYGKEFFSVPTFLPPCSEDCLYVNIWTPKAKTGRKYPVAVWIHGGAFTGGYGSEMEFDGEALTRHGVILVTLQYRLGALGYLAHPALSAASQQGVSGNYGLLDQIEALRFIQDQIEAFGGDPDNVTLFGQSAGGMSVQILASSPLAKGLFHKAIIQSGGGYDCPFLEGQSLKEAERFGEELAELAGCYTLRDLQTVPVERLLEAQQRMRERKRRVSFPLAPVIDGYVYPRGCDEAIEQGTIADIPYMLGATLDDIGESGILLASARAFSLRLEALGRAPAYVYHFVHRLPGDAAGAFHSAELWYVFGTTQRCWRPLTPADTELAARMGKAWAAFMKTGDPKAGGASEWRPYSAEDSYVQRFGLEK